jgi:hypothetical protein
VEPWRPLGESPVKHPFVYSVEVSEELCRSCQQKPATTWLLWDRTWGQRVEPVKVPVCDGCQWAIVMRQRPDAKAGLRRFAGDRLLLGQMRLPLVVCSSIVLVLACGQALAPYHQDTGRMAARPAEPAPDRTDPAAVVPGPRPMVVPPECMGPSTSSGGSWTFFDGRPVPSYCLRPRIKTTVQPIGPGPRTQGVGEPGKDT